MIINDSMLEMSPEEALKMASKLMESALLVMDRSKRLPDAYDYNTFVGCDPEGRFGRTFKVRIGSVK